MEGISFLVLLTIAMPLKYFAGVPAAVHVAGWAHGILFMLFCAALALTSWLARWPLGRSSLVFAASLIPFGPFLVDRRMRHYQATLAAGRR
jgi:integral membrane protein